jgi:catechol 2,3-dioxygenase-like lactoylglutathione lyase family enzyme
MIRNFDHVTIVVRDVEAAKQFFGLLGFREDKSVVITGPQFSTYMGVAGIEAEHVTLALVDVSPRTEVQLLRYRHPIRCPTRPSPTSPSWASITSASPSMTWRPRSHGSKPRASRFGTRSCTFTIESWSSCPGRRA